MYLETPAAADGSIPVAVIIVIIVVIYLVGCGSGGK